MLIVRLRFISQLAAALALCACSGDDSGEVVQAVPVDGGVFDGGRDPFGAEKAAALASGDDRVDAGSDLTKCTNFNLTIVGPFVQVVGEAATFWGHANDDQRHEFKLSWAAAPGEVSEDRGETTKHTCIEAGLSTISMTASLAAVCSSAIAHVVTCLEPIK
jgi:hypothetical protein